MPQVIIGLLAGDMVCTRTAYGAVLAMLFTTKIPCKTSPTIGSFSGHSQNVLVDKTLTNPEAADFTHILTIEPDMKFPPDALDRLIAHDVDIVGATYRRRGPPYEIVYYPEIDAPDIRSCREGVHRWRAIPAGLMLVRMEVFRKLKYPWFWDNPGAKFGDWMTIDMFFCDRARAAGFEVWCDYRLSAETYHMTLVPMGLDGIEGFDGAPTE